MTSIQQSNLPTVLLTNIWEDAIKSDADQVLRTIHKKNYSEVVEQINYISIIGNETQSRVLANFSDMVMPPSWYAFVYYEDMPPLIVDEEERENDYGGAYNYCIVTPYLLDHPNYLHIENPSEYDYDVDNIKNDEDLISLKDKITSALQNFNNEIENQDAVDELYKKHCFKTCLAPINLPRLTKTHPIYDVFMKTFSTMYGERALRLLDPESFEWEQYDEDFFSD